MYSQSRPRPTDRLCGFLVLLKQHPRCAFSMPTSHSLPVLRAVYRPRFLRKLAFPCVCSCWCATGRRLGPSRRLSGLCVVRPFGADLCRRAHKGQGRPARLQVHVRHLQAHRDGSRQQAASEASGDLALDFGRT
eukprot:4100161-Pleurochrysis_carterae.AAC.1